jgi:ABC-type nitrate/sulfonate/bicarbonate transport system substrate-binding protein
MTTRPSRRPRHRSIAAAALLLLSGGLAACGSSSGGAEASGGGLRKLRVVLDWTPNTNHSGMYLARAKGWYRKAGLDVSFVQPGDSTSLQVLAAGKADVAVSVAEELIPARAHGLPVQSIGAIIQHNTSGLVTLASDHITRPRDLEGKTYGGYGGPIEEPLVKELVACDGGDPSKVRFVDVGEADYRIGLQRNQYDAVWIFDGWDGIRLEQLDKVKTGELRFIDHTDCIPDWYTPLLATSTKVERSRGADLKAFMSATAHGYREAMAHPDEAVDALMEASPDLDRRLVTRSARYLATRYADDPADWGMQQAAIWSRFARFLTDNGIVDGKVDARAAWTNAYLPT